MDQAELAEQLVAVSIERQQILLAQNAPLVDVDLAWRLKSLYDEMESSDPAQAGRVVTTLSLLVSVTKNMNISAIAAWVEGMTMLDTGQMQDAVHWLEVAEEQFLQVGSPIHAAATQVSKLHALAVLGFYEKAIACGRQAHDVLLAHGDLVAAGKIEQNLGNIYFLLDLYPTAEEHYNAARKLYEQVGDQKQLIQIDNCLATALTSQYRFREAGMIYERALASAEAAGMVVRVAEIETNQGCLALFQGQYDRALDFLERSRRRYVALGMPHDSAIADQELADAYLELNLIPEAVAIYDRVGPIFSAMGLQAEHARTLAYHGMACVALGKLDTARLLLAEAGSLYEAAGNAVGKALVTLVEAQSHYVEKDYVAAAALAAQAEAPFAEVHAWGRLLLARWLQGESLRAQGNALAAQSLLKHTLQQAEQWLALPILQRCHTSLGLAAEALGDTSGAETSFKRAIALIEEARSPLPAEEFRTAFMIDKLIPYKEMVRLCLADGGPGRVAEALGYVEQARSRALMDIVGGLKSEWSEPADPYEAGLSARLELLREELNWFYSQINRPHSDAASRGASIMSDLYNAVRAHEAEISEIMLQLRQRNVNKPVRRDSFDLVSLMDVLGQETALVEYFSLDGNLLAFVVADKRLEVIQLPTLEDEVEAELRQFYFQLGALRYGAHHLRAHHEELVERTRRHLHGLYDRLLRPLEALLDRRRLLVVPHRFLHYVPFHALHNGAGYVIEQREVCCVPSASILQHCLAAPRQPLTRAALFGVSDDRTPRVHDEIFALEPLFPDAVTLLDEEATYASLHQDSSTANVLHMACHGRFRHDNPLFSSLQLSDTWLTVRDTYRLDLRRCELVTLSACETGVNAVAPGDEWIGLARGFFSAGAPSLLVSQWIVDDESTAELMILFYSRLQEGTSPASALRYAQCQLLKTKPHPFFWAPFVLMGRW
jgi:CHAT domain-containing protein/Flp pilus assembly protein TadD